MLLAVLTMLPVIVRADNMCTEGGPYTNGMSCLSAGSWSTGYVLSSTSAGVGQLIPLPTASGLSITNGLESSMVTYDCTPELDHPITNAFSYALGNLYFVPAIPQTIWTPGTYAYTAYVNANGSPCSPLTNTLGTVTVTILTNNPDVLFDVDFGNHTNSLKTGYAVIGDSTSDFWNGYAKTNVASGSLTNLVTANGIVSPVGLLVTNLPTLHTNGSSDAMYNDYLGTNSAAATLTFTNLPGGTWSIYLYASDGSFDLKVGTNDYGTQTCHDGSPRSTPLAWQQGVQYVAFQNVFLTNGQGMTVTISPGISNVAMISGLQVASLNHVPLPFSTLTPSSLVAWGGNSYGQTNVPGGLTNVVAIASGGNFNLALTSGGTVAAWGDNSYGQTTVPGGLANVTAIAAGGHHALVLKSDGTMAAWGWNNWSQATVPHGLASVVAIAAGDSHSLALLGNGTVVAWGLDNVGQVDVPAGLSNVVAIGAGYAHSMALKSDGTVVAWGNNADGETNVPAGLSNVVAIACGGYHNLALKGNGTVVAWGLDNNGQVDVPGGLSNVVAIACGGYHSLALKGNGTVAAWGNNGYGQTTVPAGVTNVVAIAGGYYHSLALRNAAIPSDQIPYLYPAGAPGTVNVTLDEDYDGVSDVQELADRTNPNDANSALQILLGYWPFDNTNTWVGAEGQLPLLATNVVGVPSWDTNAVLIDSTNPAILKYRDVETSGNANINLRCGSVQFWFKPDWSSTNAGGVGPQGEGRFIEMGTKGTTNGWWGLAVNSTGTNIYFGTQTNSSSTLTTNLTATMSWTSNVWHQVVLTYSPTNSSLYVDGQPVVTNGTGVAYYPALNVRTNGFNIGSSASGTNQARGTFDDLQTFNYALGGQQILTNYQACIPLNIAGLLLWLKANSLVGLTNNAPVGTWYDSSGWNNNATQGTTSNQPLYVTNIIDGLPVVYFNGTSSYLNLPNVLNGTTQAEEFVVLRAATNLPSANMPLWDMGNGGGYAPGYPASSGQIVDDFGSSLDNTVGVPSQPLNQYGVYEVAGRNGDWTAWLNAVMLAELPGNTYAYYNNANVLGGVPGWGHYFAGDIAEVLVFNRTLTASERITVNGYLNGKYGLVPPVPPAPTNLVAQAISTNQISLTWSETLTNGGATQIGIERSTTSNGVYSVVAQVANTLSYVDTNLAAGTTYYYEVQAKNLNTWSAPSSEAWATTLTNGTSMPFGNLLLWLKADTGLAQLGTNVPVSFWADQSGNLNDATQPAGANQPLWVSGALNGMPVVRFNSANNQHFSLPNVLNGTTQAEAFVVLKAATNLPTVEKDIWRMGSVGNFYYCYPNTSGQICEGFGSTSGYNIGVPAQPINQYHLYEVASQNGSWGAWINGLMQYETTNNTYAYYTGGYYLGLADGEDGFDGDMAEVLVFNRTLTPSERDAVGKYLFSKYGLSQYALNTSLPSSPTNFITTGTAPYQLNLQWLPTSTNAYSFHVERALGTNGTFQEIESLPSYLTNFVDTTAVATNVYLYRIRAHNLFGDSYSAVISPPTINLTNVPATTVMENTTNLIGAQAADADGTVSNVQFFAGFYSNGFTFATSVLSPYTNSWMPTMTGTYTLAALATDNQGNSQFSSSITVSVYLDSNGDGIPDYLQVSQGNDPINTWIPPTNEISAPVITLLIPTNAVIVQ